MKFAAITPMLFSVLTLCACLDQNQTTSDVSARSKDAFDINNYSASTSSSESLEGLWIIVTNNLSLSVQQSSNIHGILSTYHAEAQSREFCLLQKTSSDTHPHYQFNCHLFNDHRATIQWDDKNKTLIDSGQNFTFTTVNENFIQGHYQQQYSRSNLTSTPQETHSLSSNRSLDFSMVRLSPTSNSIGTVQIVAQNKENPLLDEDILALQEIRYSEHVWVEQGLSHYGSDHEIRINTPLSDINLQDSGIMTIAFAQQTLTSNNMTANIMNNDNQHLNIDLQGDESQYGHIEGNVQLSFFD